MVARTYHPDLLQAGTSGKPLDRGDDLAELTPQVLAAELDRLEAAAREVLAACSTAELLTRIEGVVDAWADPDFEPRQRAEARLPAVTAFSPAMIREGLTRHFQPLRRPELARLLERERVDRDRLDRGTEPGLTALVLSGNLPGVGVVPTLVSLLLRASVFVKAASGDPLFPVLFAESIAMVDSGLGRCVAAAYWRGGRRDVEDVLFARAQLVSAYGSDTAISAITPRVRGRFVAHGHRLSFGYITADALAAPEAMRAAAKGLADDVVMWDQHGCLSPQLCYLETTDVDALHRLAMAVAEELSVRATALPIRQLSMVDRAAIAHFRHEAEWAARTSLLASDDGVSWSVRIEQDPAFMPSCLNRCLRLKPIGGLNELASVVAAQRRYLEACGIATAPAERDEVTRALKAMGVHRVCALGEMQRPTLEWRQGGRSLVHDLLGDRLGRTRAADAQRATQRSSR